MRKLICLLPALLLMACGPQTDHIRVLATSDTHGMFYPYNYALNEPNPSGSLAQVATCVRQEKDDCTLLFEAGDVIQDNSADLFLQDSLHPMIAAMNAIGYDAWVTGNHEYNYGLPTLRRIIDQCHAPLLCGNVCSPEGQLLGAPSRIFNVKGVRVGVIGMVTPNIVNWDKKNLEGWTVTNPVEESVQLVKQLRKKTDILIAVEHFGLESEYGTPGSGARELAMACPELDLIIAAHAHVAYADSVINGVPVVANRNWCATMTEVDFTRGDDGRWTVSPRILMMQDYQPDSAVMALLEPYHQRALAVANEKIGTVVGPQPLIGPSRDGLHSEFMQDAPWPDLIADAMRFYSGADVVASFIVPTKATILPGDITRADAAVIYKYGNTLYTLHMTGRQLRKYMEWATTFFLTWHPGDKTIVCNPEARAYNCDFFTGVNYEVNLSREIGSRIENLCWATTGKPVLDTDTFTLAVSNYRAATHLLNPGVIFSKEDGVPELLEADIRSDIGGIRDLLIRYVQDELQGVIRPATDSNWRITGVPAGIRAVRNAEQR